MQTSDQIGAHLNPGQTESPQTRRRWGVGIVLFSGLILVLVLGRIWTAGGAYDSALAEGEAALLLAIETGEPRHFDEADSRLSVAATVGFIDPYPVFVLNAAQRIRVLKAGSEDQSIYYHHLSQGDFGAAREVAGREKDPKRRTYLVRLVDELDN